MYTLPDLDKIKQHLSEHAICCTPPMSAKKSIENGPAAPPSVAQASHPSPITSWELLCFIDCHKPKKKNSILFNIKNRWSHHCDVIIECEHLQCKLQTCSSTYLALQVTSTIFLNFLLNIWSRYCNFIYAFLTWQIRSTMQPERQEIFINLYQQ